MAVQDVGGLKETLTRIEMERERLAELSESFSRVIRYFVASPADGEVQAQPSPAVSARSEVRRILEARGQQPPFAV